MKRFLCLAGLAVTLNVAADDSSVVERFLDYKSLPCLAKEKIDVEEALRFLCSSPKSVVGPHLRQGIKVYANPSAVEAQKTKSTGHHYPIGTCFVKEKFAFRTATEPDLITVMEKVENKGAVTDWSFYMIQLSDHTLVKEKQAISCAECHARFEKTDFISGKTTALLQKYVIETGGGGAK